MPVQERAICRRLRQFRLWTSYSQAEFCALVGLNSRAYASYEYARSQLNYPSARRILKAFCLLNPIWLAEGHGEMLEVRIFSYPAPEATGFGPRTAFSQVYRASLQQPLLKAVTAHLLKPISRYSRFTVDPDVPGRLYGKEQFGDMLSGWLAALPDGKVNDFLNDVFRRAAQVVARYPRDDDEAAIQRRLDEVYRIEAKRRFPSSRPEKQRNVLTETESATKLLPVKLQLKNLRTELNRLTEESGKKTELAGFLGAPLASVSRWLSGEREPGGETTLKMLRWVQEQESQPNAPGSATNAAKGKVTRRKLVYEKKPTSSHKQE